MKKDKMATERTPTGKQKDQAPGFKRGGKVKMKKAMKAEGMASPKRLDKAGRGFDTTDAGVSPVNPLAKNALKKGGKC